MNELTTIAIYRDDLDTLRRWRKAKAMTNQELIRAWVEHVKGKLQQRFYNSLPMPPNYRKPLDGKKIAQNYK